MLHPDDMRRAIGWAHLTAKAFGYTVTREGKMVWVNTGSSEIGCSDDMDFVSFMSGEAKARAARGELS